MLNNFTLLEMFTIKRAKPKVGFLLGISIVTILAYFFKSPFFFAISGSIVYISYIICSLYSYGNQGVESQD
jgi:hypothetical protein